MEKIRIKPARPVYPSPAALITSIDADGKPNIITLAEVFNISISKPVIIGIAVRTATYSHGLIKESGEFVVNQPTTSILAKVDGCGSVSGRKGADKFAEFGLTALPAAMVKPPLIAECPVNVECKVVGLQTVGDHDLFLGEVVVQHVDEDKLDDRGKPRADTLDPIVYMESEYWSVGKRLERHGYSRGNVWNVRGE